MSRKKTPHQVSLPELAESPQMIDHIEIEDPADLPQTGVPHFLLPHKTIRIAVSGDVFLTRLEKEIVDTQAFQRLRGIRQLGNAMHVYPTALHTRFDHSLGTLAMAESMLKAIKDNLHSSEDERYISFEQEALARLYALLHDITHIPFGHLIEDELLIFKRHDENPDRINYFLGPQSEIGSLITKHLGAALYTRLMEIFHSDGNHASLKDDAFVYDIVSNTVCADLLDYLARDSYFCNLGFWFEYRFLNFLYLHRCDDGSRRVFVRLWKGNKSTPRRDTLSDLTRLLEARYLIAERVYFHPAKIVSGTMLGRSLLEANLAEKLSEVDLYSHSDDTLLRFLEMECPPLASNLARQLRTRKLYRPLRKYTEADFLGVQDRNYQSDALNSNFGKVKEPLDRLQFENRLAEEVDAEPGDILVYAPPRKMNPKLAKMQVLWKGTARDFKDIDDPVITPRLQEIIKAHEMLWGIHVFVRRDLSDKQLALLRRACDLEFLNEPDRQQESQLEYYEKLIELHLEKLRINIPSDSEEFFQRRAQAALRLADAAHDRRSWEERISAVTSEYFGDKQDES